MSDDPLDNLVITPARRYAGIWLQLINNPKSIVRVKVRQAALMRRVRKAVWKEKSLDLVNRDKFRLECKMHEDTGIVEFSLKPILSGEDV